MKIATSWDDGLESDKRLLDILSSHGVGASFAITAGRHRDHLVPNDVRDEKYGRLMRLDDLPLYSEHDVCNHTRDHWEMRLDPQGVWQLQISDGKVQLEDLFQRSVSGIIWPYGVSNVSAQLYAASVGHSFGRTTPAPDRSWHPGEYRCWDIVPFHWRTPLEQLLNSNHTHVALSGHTYELQTEDDWQYLDEFYRTLSRDSGCQLVTLSELAKDIVKYDST